MKKIIFIADLFLEDYIGGGELNNEELINQLILRKFDVKKIHSYDVDINFIKNNKDNFFIVGNFIGLKENVKEELYSKKYVIYEHDHKYLKNRNPTSYKNYVSDEKNLINKNFYKNAKAILTQSKIHTEVIWKNLGIENIINCSGNIWSKNQIDILKKYKDTEKQFDCAILQSNNNIKNTAESIDYCKKNNLNYNLIPFSTYEKYISELAKCKKMVFFPKVLETLSRTSIEAKILGCNLITNNYLGVISEEWIKKDQNYIIDYINNRSKDIVNIIVDCLNGDEKKHFYNFKKMPKISIITSLYKANLYIENFLYNITKQTIFNDCELILVDASPEEEVTNTINKYKTIFSNIKHIKLEKDPGIYGCWNIGIEVSNNEYICNTNVDDVRFLDNLEILRKHLFYDESIDLVYGDSQEVNEIPSLEKQYPLKLSEHSLNKFSSENMIKCLPGPLPLWKKSLHDSYGFFDEKYKFAGDWEFWLRLTKNNVVFKKIDIISGYYYHNPNGKSTNQDSFKEKFLEEKEIFFKYKDVFGQNFYIFKQWFERQF